jgi:cytochrome c oxidase subunit 5b
MNFLSKLAAIFKRPFKPARLTYSTEGPTHDHPPKYKPIVGPGRPVDAIGTPYEMSAGLERIEYLTNMSGSPVYLDQPLRVDHFGTPANPIVVDVLENGQERIVGCTGFPKYSHVPMWMRINGKARCIECGQAFVTRPVQ